jgi:hypothetical protein
MNDYFTFSPSINEFHLTEQNIISALGYKNVEIPEAVTQGLKSLLQNSLDNAAIECGFRIFENKDIIISKEELSIKGVELKIDKIIALHLKYADTVAIFAATIGSEFDQYLSELKNKDILDSYLADTIGSELVENVGDWLEIKLKNIIGSKNISNRLSPGYCGWKVSEQHKLFSLLPHNFCGITLNDSALMKPIKSISGIIGIGEKLKRLDYQCKICSLENCYKRNRVRD